ncbi:MAG: hypothetical protein EHM35_00255 [Planctomycetaceae bacterium]|nr:MAG: hypothetical protein EHM35_00255 [Planctomycetaceae bacterium]
MTEAREPYNFETHAPPVEPCGPSPVFPYGAALHAEGARAVAADLLAQVARAQAERDEWRERVTRLEAELGQSNKWVAAWANTARRERVGRKAAEHESGGWQLAAIQQRAELEQAQGERDAARAQYEGQKAALSTVMAELTAARAENERLRAEIVEWSALHEPMACGHPAAFLASPHGEPQYCALCRAIQERDGARARLAEQLVDEAAAMIWNNAESHRDTWEDASNWYWFRGLLEEVGELGLALAGKHRHYGTDTVSWELRQIGGIALNWLRNRPRRGW